MMPLSFTVQNTLNTLLKKQHILFTKVKIHITEKILKGSKIIFGNERLIRDTLRFFQRHFTSGKITYKNSIFILLRDYQIICVIFSVPSYENIFLATIVFNLHLFYI